MSIPFGLWGQRGWPNLDIVGESHHLKPIRALFGPNLKAGGTEMTATAQLIPEPQNRHDRNAVAVWIGSHHVGYLSREDAVRYAPVLSALVAEGWAPQVSARVWAGQWSSDSRDQDGFSASVRLDLAEPHLLLPANMPPGQQYRLLPAGSSIQVTGEDKHLDVLSAWLCPEGECWVYATLHELTEQLARTTRTVVEIRIDDHRVGQLTPKMSGELLPAVRHLAEQGQTATARAIVKGNRIKTEVVLHVARAHELPDSWLSVPASAPTTVTPTPSAPVPVVAPPERSYASVPAAMPVVIPPAPTGIKFVVPPNWPQPPARWIPQPGWRPDPAWPAPPEGWQWWIPVWD